MTPTNRVLRRTAALIAATAAVATVGVGTSTAAPITGKYVNKCTVVDLASSGEVNFLSCSGADHYGRWTGSWKSIGANTARVTLSKTVEAHGDMVTEYGPGTTFTVDTYSNGCGNVHLRGNAEGYNLKLASMPEHACGTY